MSNKTAKFIKNKDRPEVAGLSTKVAVDWVKVADGSPELADGRFILKMTKCVNHFTLLSFTYERRGTYLISRQPTQFQPPHFSIFGQFLVSFSFRTIFASSRRARYWYQKMWNFLTHFFVHLKSLPHPAPYSIAHAKISK